jgi:hypothetical protein
MQEFVNEQSDASKKASIILSSLAAVVMLNVSRRKGQMCESQVEIDENLKLCVTPLLSPFPFHRTSILSSWEFYVILVSDRIME